MARPSETGSCPAGQAPSGLDASRFDPARVDFLAAAIQLMVAIEWEAPAIMDGVNVEHRCQILLDHAHEARDVLRKHGVDPDNPEKFLEGISNAA